MKAMERAAATVPEIAERVRVFRWRDVEEFYDLKSDPNCLVNLAKVPQHQNRFQAMRNEMRAWMKRTDDPLLNSIKAWYSEAGQSYVPTLPADYVSPVMPFA